MCVALMYGLFVCVVDIHVATCFMGHVHSGVYSNMGTRLLVGKCTSKHIYYIL